MITISKTKVTEILCICDLNTDLIAFSQCYMSVFSYVWISPYEVDFIKFQNISDFEKHDFASISAKKKDSLEIKFQIGGLDFAFIW